MVSSALRYRFARLIILLLITTPTLSAQPQDRGDGWVEARKPFGLSYQESFVAGGWEPSGARGAIFPGRNNLPGFEIGLSQAISAERYYFSLPMGGVNQRFRSTEVELLFRTAMQGGDQLLSPIEYLAAFTMAYEDNPERTLLAHKRLRGGYRGALGSNSPVDPQQLFIDVSLGTNSIALGLTDPYRFVEGSSIYGPSTFRLYAGSIAFITLYPEAAFRLEPYLGIDGHYQLHRTKFSLLYDVEARYDQQTEWTARFGIKLGDWKREGLVLDVFAMSPDSGLNREPAPEERNFVLGLGIGYELTR